MLMALGPFRFTVPTFSFEQLSRSTSGRVEEVPVIGRAPIIHKLGPGPEMIELQSTFYPLSMNYGAMAQVEGIRQAVRLQTSLLMVAFSGAVFGRYIVLSISENHSSFVAASAQEVAAQISLRRDPDMGFF